MWSVTLVQILEKAVCLSLDVNTFGKSVNQSVLPPTVGGK